METDWRWDCMQVSIRALPKEAAVDHNWGLLKLQGRNLGL
jgi:hypothetical protein